MNTKQEYLLSIPLEYLLGFIGHASLVRPGNTYFTKKDFVQRLLRHLDKSDCEWLYSTYSRNIPCEKAAELFLMKYPTAEIIKFSFINYISEKDNDLGEISFEFPIPRTRVDIARIQGDSYAYEIKSIRDSFKRMFNQISAIKRLFEKVYLVIPKYKNHISSIYADKKIGIYFYFIEDKNIIFEKRRKAHKLNSLNSLAQLSLFHKDELNILYSDVYKTSSVRLNRKSIEQKIANKLSSRKINLKFKEVLKIRFQKSHINNFTCARN